MKTDLIFIFLGFWFAIIVAFLLNGIYKLFKHLKIKNKPNLKIIQGGKQERGPYGGV